MSKLFSWEPGMCFSEHLKYENGKVTNESVEYQLIQDPKTGACKTVGGFDGYFELAEPVKQGNELSGWTVTMEGGQQ